MPIFFFNLFCYVYIYNPFIKILKLLFLLPLLLGLMTPAIAHNEANSKSAYDSAGDEEVKDEDHSEGKAGKEEVVDKDI